MAVVKDAHSEMALARQKDGISVIFDQSSPASSHCRSRSRSSGRNTHSSVSRRHRGRGSRRRRRRSPSSTSSSRSRSSSQPRSRSHPRCHRLSSRCRCDGDRRRGRRRSRRCGDRSESSSRSPSPSRFTRRRHCRSQNRDKKTESQVKDRCPQSPSRTNRSESKSRSSERSVTLSLEGNGELLEAAQADAVDTLGMEKMELPDGVKAILPEQSEPKWESKWESLEPEPETETRVRQSPEWTSSQSHETEPDDVPSLRMSPKPKISFSINNSVARPTVAAPSFAKVTAGVDIYDSRKPYGQWVAVKSGRTAHRRKQALATFC
ncbi:arginine/serine-rich protein 1 [Brachionichthys hirsutus]|uniref:arginine/serine-rich protein 1 n=1 Tax=Brachionichthys hirsutus TaxID=412623 RepID=UPI003604CBB6